MQIRRKLEPVSADVRDKVPANLGQASGFSDANRCHFVSHGARRRGLSVVGSHYPATRH